MTMEDQVIRREIYQELGTAHTVVDEVPVSTPIVLTVTDTFYASGRKDCAVKVPVIKSKSTNQYPN